MERANGQLDELGAGERERDVELEAEVDAVRREGRAVVAITGRSAARGELEGEGEGERESEGKRVEMLIVAAERDGEL